MKYKIKQKIDINIKKHHPNADSATNDAYIMAYITFGMHDCGLFHNIYSKGQHTLVVKFISLTCTAEGYGLSFNYKFKAWVK